ncbi:uncharacterized protein LOC131183202 [Hevea brasiliensis]|uniref:uncharacterized protein LOC131183202 n=1 Tax=Hevea brasiliensis TaxID=3981 RepID=UPI0025F1C2C2|nr:uncharacterized protein LOC131183202 [Hevea brasiliensis]
MIVRAFDYTKRDVLGDIELPLLIEACTFNVTFQVMDIEPAHTMLLGRPWIHSANAMPSTLHQRIKYVMDGKIITVRGEEAMLVTKPQSVPYVEAAERSLESSFKALELQGTTLNDGGAAAMVTKVMLRNGYKEGKGLGATLRGIIDPILATQRNGHSGLGYEEDALTNGRFWMRNMLRDQRFDRSLGKMKSISKIVDVFTRPIIEIIKEEDGESSLELSINVLQPNPILEMLILPIVEGQELYNWEAEDIPMLFFETTDQSRNNNSIDSEIPYVNFKSPMVATDTSDSEEESMKEQMDVNEPTLVPYGDEMSTLNLGIEENKKELKIVNNKELEGMIQLLKEFIDVVKYPEWIANVISVMKKDGRVRVCVDYKELNKVSLKDDFPLPHIDMLIDNIVGLGRCSCTDGASGYNQILMDEGDKEKTAFITQWGVFCYRVMPFGLKNTGATYQRAMLTLFHDMMYKEVEVYVDDMIIKSRGTKSHVQLLRMVFERFRKYRLKLNPIKCVFGARSGKLLGFIVSEKGIEVDLDKIQAIQEMPSLKRKRDVHSFLGKLNYISRFISNLTTKAEPIFKLLKKNNTVKWDEACQEAFKKIKQYLSSPTLLVPPVTGRPLILYMVVQ